MIVYSEIQTYRHSRHSHYMWMLLEVEGE